MKLKVARSSSFGIRHKGSVVVSIPLQCIAVNDDVTLDDCGMHGVVTDNRGPVEVDLVVNDEQRVVVVDDIVVNADTIQVLLKQVLEE